MIRILFCNISYLPYYNTRLDRVAPKNGGAYVAKMHDAYEKHNFEECADGQYRGFVETKYRIGYEEGIATNTYNSLHIERIDPFAKGKTYLDDVLVVFCAKPENSQTVIVGWYKNATVFRRRPFYNGRFFNIQAWIFTAGRSKNICCSTSKARRNWLWTSKYLVCWYTRMQRVCQ